MKFQVELSLSKTKEIEVDATDLRQAIQKIRDKNKEWVIEAIDDKLVFGFDESTDEPIFEEDDYVCDEEGVMLLRKNVES